METVHPESEIWFPQLGNSCEVDPLSLDSIKNEPKTISEPLVKKTVVTSNLAELLREATPQSLNFVEDVSEDEVEPQLVMDIEFESKDDIVPVVPLDDTNRGIKRKLDDVSSNYCSDDSTVPVTEQEITEPDLNTPTEPVIPSSNISSSKKMYSQKIVKYGLSKLCVSCQIHFKSQSDLERHKVIHNNTGSSLKLCLPISCISPSCNEKFINFCSLAIHNRVVHEHKRIKNPLVKITVDMKFFKCPICYGFFQTEKLFLTHIQPHTLIIEIPCSCMKCECQFSKFKDIQKHYLEYHNDKLPYKCRNCESEFSALSSLLNHSKHHYNSVVFCKYCENELLLSKIVSKEHFNSCLKYKKRCPICGKQCKDMFEHLNSHDVNATYQFVCIICFQTFQTNKLLSFHQCTQHFSISLTAASVISVIFKYNKNSKFIPRKSDSNLYFTCVTCRENFETNELAIKHFNEIHANPIFYQCTECSQIVRNTARKNHFKVHYGNNGNCTKNIKEIEHLVDQLFNRVELSIVHKSSNELKGISSVKTKSIKSKNDKSDSSKILNQTGTSNQIVSTCSNNATEKDSSIRDDVIDLKIIEPNSEVTTNVEESTPNIVANVPTPTVKNKTSNLNPDTEDDDILIIDVINSYKSVPGITQTNTETSQKSVLKKLPNTQEASVNSKICETKKNDTSVIKCNGKIVENSDKVLDEVWRIPLPGADVSESALVINELDDDDGCEIVEIRSNLATCYVCTKCDYSFENQSDLSKHTFIHFETKVFNSLNLCDRAFCKKRFDTFCSYKIHFKSTHERIKIKNPIFKNEQINLYKCEICLAVFNNLYLFLKHCPNYEEFISDCN